MLLGISFRNYYCLVQKEVLYIVVVWYVLMYKSDKITKYHINQRRKLYIYIVLKSSFVFLSLQIKLSIIWFCVKYTTLSIHSYLEKKLMKASFILYKQKTMLQNLPVNFFLNFWLQQQNLCHQLTPLPRKKHISI